MVGMDMPLLRSLRFCGRGFYKSAAPTALAPVIARKHLRLPATDGSCKDLDLVWVWFYKKVALMARFNFPRDEKSKNHSKTTIGSN
jgi:hypothetical protein